jgi:hypothetical protein
MFCLYLFCATVFEYYYLVRSNGQLSQSFSVSEHKPRFNFKHNELGIPHLVRLIQHHVSFQDSKNSNSGSSNSNPGFNDLPAYGEAGPSNSNANQADLPSYGEAGPSNTDAVHAKHPTFSDGTDSSSY